jgi:hypothetical protein
MLRSAVAVVTVLLCGGLAWAQEKTKQSSESGGQNTTIQVHGHWVITVLNPDKTVASRTQFENALTLNGTHPATLSLACNKLERSAV